MLLAGTSSARAQATQGGEIRLLMLGDSITAAFGLAPSQMRENLAAILDALEKRNIPTLLAGMLAPPNLGADYGRDFAGVFETLSRERPEVIFYPFLLDGVAGNPELNQPDRIHPNRAGVEVIARRMLPVIETLLDRVRVSAAG